MWCSSRLGPVVKVRAEGHRRKPMQHPRLQDEWEQQRLPAGGDASATFLPKACHALPLLIYLHLFSHGLGLSRGVHAQPVAPSTPCLPPRPRAQLSPLSSSCGSCASLCLPVLRT